MKSYKYLIIGGGTTAGYAAKEFVNQQIGKNELCIISAESIYPMNRPPLSKDYLRDADRDDEISINEKDFYEKHGVEVKLETYAKDVKFDLKHVTLDNGETIGYEKLLIATGSKLKRLSVAGSGLRNIFYLRNIKQSDNIREQAKNAKHAVVVGGGYIGTETAASMKQLGLDVTLIVPEKILLSKFATSDISGFFEKEFQKRGIEIMFENKVTAFHGNKTVEEVELSSGKRIKTDMVVAGIGVEPNVSIFENSGLKINKGILVNEFCETNIKGVYAAGDVVYFPDLIFNKTRHVEHWEHAFEQGAHVAKVMTGNREPYKFLPFFFSDVFDHSYEYFGDNEKAAVVKNRGDIEKGDFSTWWFNGKKLAAAFVMASRPEEEGKLARKWITNRTYLDLEKITDTGVEMKSLELNTELHPNEF
jgi:3-phenylpropionate/trans-cinnamate dioxygenase ferredoxin reductase component